MKKIKYMKVKLLWQRLQYTAISKLFTQYKINPTIYIILSASLLVFFYNTPNIIIKVYLNFSHGMSYIQSFFNTFAEAFLALAIVTVFLGIFSFSKILLKLWVLIFMVMSSVFAYYILVYGIFIDEMLIGTIVKTNQEEVYSVISLAYLGYLIFFTIIPCIFFVWSLKIIPYGRGVNFVKHVGKILIFCVVLLFFAGIFNYNLYINKMFFHKDVGYVKYTTKSSLSFYMPLNYMAAIFQYYNSLNKLKYTNVQNIAQKYPFTMPNTLQNTNMNIVLIIGESARGDHQSLNGYYRNTNPNLAKIPNFISFPKVYSCNTYSVASINCLLSYKSRNNFQMDLQESNLISVFNNLGFASYFLSTQSIYNDLNYMYFAFKDSKVKILNNQVRRQVPTGEYLYDEHMLPFVQDILAERSIKHKLIILYLTGSHAPYNTRYPAKFNVFKGKNYRVDTYDNSILYTDYVLFKLIQQLQQLQQNSFVYYVADHGESLGENNKFKHGAKYEIAPIEQKQVAQFVWASDSMIKLMGQNYQNIIAHKNEELSQDSVFHSLFQCFGIHSKIVDKNLSICK